MAFPNNFVWGAATAAYQIEGAAAEDGKGPSVWDTFCRREGAIKNGDTGDVACDHYHRHREDVALMADLGLQAYRLSISWPRVLPQGTGKPNEKGLDFYDRLIDDLLAKKITPFVTLFHWDYPQALYDRGGWLNDESPAWFAEYTKVVVERLSDRVRFWMTQNEPVCFIDFGHKEGRNAPGDKLDEKDVLRAAQNAILAHGRSVEAIRAAARTPAQVGIVNVGTNYIPASADPKDVEAARAAQFTPGGSDRWNHAFWLDPVFSDGPPIDFLGVNLYHGVYARAGKDGRPEKVPYPPGHPRTAYYWPVTPEAMYWSTKFLHERYGAPIYITESGLSGMDWVARDGKVHDPGRIDYVHRYLAQMHRAMEEGVPVKGYFLWSLMDNFEWSSGYAERFGIVHVDYATQKRTPKDSALWYRDVIRSNGALLLNTGSQPGP
ncbi:MAG: glycoside hydrolase family 1 protein [Planctomycetota bacterium]|jgi:beta-glucosidase